LFTINRISKRSFLKTSARRQLRTLALLVILASLLAANSGQALAATIYSSRFSLYRWDGPLYIDFNAKCTELAAIDIVNSSNDLYHGPLNGNWRAWPKLTPRKTYTLYLICQDKGGHGRSWEYSVWYSGSTMRVYRTRVVTW